MIGNTVGILASSVKSMPYSLNKKLYSPAGIFEDHPDELIFPNHKSSFAPPANVFVDVAGSIIN